MFLTGPIRIRSCSLACCTTCGGNIRPRCRVDAGGATTHFRLFALDLSDAKATAPHRSQPNARKNTHRTFQNTCRHDPTCPSGAPSRPATSIKPENSQLNRRRETSGLEFPAPIQRQRGGLMGFASIDASPNSKPIPEVADVRPGIAVDRRGRGASNRPACRGSGAATHALRQSEQVDRQSRRRDDR